MELALSSEDAAFRDEVRAFIAENYSTQMRVANPETERRAAAIWRSLVVAAQKW